jgi:ABC-type Mn2+/Zn2+ transport system permease subunit
MLILPGATSYLLTGRLSVMLLLSFVHAALSTVLGMHLGILLDCSYAAAMVVAGGFLFLLAWIFSPTQGLITRLRRRDLLTPADQSDTSAASA